MREYKLVTQPKADSDMWNIFDRYYRLNPQAARKFAEDIKRAFSQLQQHPEMAQLSRNPRYAKRGIRKLLLVYDCVLIYRFSNDMINVLRVGSCKQKYFSDI